MIRPIRIWVEWAARDPNQKWSAILQNDVRFRWCSARTTERFVRSACLCAHLAGTSASRIPVMIIPFQSSSSFKCGQKKKNRPKDILSEICVWILDDKKKNGSSHKSTRHDLSNHPSITNRPFNLGLNW